MAQSKIAVLLFATAILNGCAPIPHFERVAPGMVGVIESDLETTGVVILACEPRSYIQCNTYIKYQVRPDGTFEIGVDERFRLFTVIGDTQYQWGFNIEHNGKIYPGYRGKSYGVVPDQPVRLVCNLQKSNFKNHEDTNYVCSEIL